MPFQELGLSLPLVTNVRKLGYESLTPIQAQAIPAVKSGRDVVATAQTGTGKTAAFLLPILDKLLERPRGKIGGLVLTPTRELAAQIDASFRKYSAGTKLRSALVMGGFSHLPQQRALRVADLVIATPGRLLDHMESGNADLSALAHLILDEADQMFDMGFLPDLKRIVARCPKQRQTLLFSATMPPEIEGLCKAVLTNPVRIEIGTAGKAAHTVTQIAYPVSTKRKAALLKHLLEEWEMPSVLVFTRTKHGAKRLADVLFEAGHGVAELHSDRSPTQRARAMQAFRDKAVPVMVATNIAARGIDVRHITHVVSFDVPNAAEEYVHRIGRTGRAGDTGQALVFVAPEEQGQMSRIERSIRQRIPREHVKDFDYASGGMPEVGGDVHRRRPDALPAGKQKPTRGQGRRR